MEEYIRLLRAQKETENCEFKRQWVESDNRANLLYSILCLVNNTKNQDSYLILGFDEKKEDYVSRLVGIADDKNRMTTLDLNNMIKDIRFSNNAKIDLEVITFIESGVLMDVIKISNSIMVPFILEKSYGKGGAASVNPHLVFSRIKNSNTPRDRNAPFDLIEKLWQKRFGINDTPKGKFLFALNKPDMWDRIVNYEEDYYSTIHPNCTISIQQDALTFPKQYVHPLISHRLLFPKCEFNYYKVTCKAESHEVHVDLISSFDSKFRLLSPEVGFMPYIDDFSITYSYMYFIENSIKCALYDWFYIIESKTGYGTHGYGILRKHIIIFKSIEERVSFENYLEENSEMIVQEIKSELKSDSLIIEKSGTEYEVIDIYTSFIIKKWYRNFIMRHFLD